MTLALEVTNRFKRDAKKAKKRGKDLDKLWSIVETLQREEDLAPRHRPHRLSGDWAHAWECHIEPDWLLIWQIGDDILILIRTGSHADLFG